MANNFGNKETESKGMSPLTLLVGTAIGTPAMYLLGAFLLGELTGKPSSKNNIEVKVDSVETHLEYINNDSLPDLVYKTGEVYLQTKDGNFVSYEKVLEDELKHKQDSLKKVYENKLEKGVQ